MKKFILSVMMFCCAMVMPVQAEDTDISTLDNVVYIEPVSIAAGSQYTLSVNMKNAVEAEGFGFDLYLPEGIMVATDGDGFPMVELSTQRTTAKKTNSFDAAFQSDGSLRVLAASTNASTISGNDGEVCLITIQVASNVSAGTYPMYLRKVAISDTEAQSHRTEQVESTITVTAPADTRTILDESSTTIPDEAENVNVRVRRTIKAGNWSTICLPFSMTEEQVKSAFGEDVLLGDFTGCDVDDVTGSISVNFSDVTAIEANHPYIIKVSEDIAEFTVDGVDITPEEEPVVDRDEETTGTGRNKKTTYNSFIGTYVAETVIPDYALFLNDNKFWFSTGISKMDAFRGYFDFVTAGAEYDEESLLARSISLSFYNSETTGIKTVAKRTATDGAIYNINGQRVNGQILPKGIYIKDNKKVFVR